MNYRSDKLMIDGHTDTHTHTHIHTQATTIPEGQNWPRVKNVSSKRPSDPYKLEYTRPSWAQIVARRFLASSHCLKQCWLIVIPEKKFEWCLNHNTIIFMQGNKMNMKMSCVKRGHLPWLQCVKSVMPRHEETWCWSCNLGMLLPRCNPCIWFIREW